MSLDTAIPFWMYITSRTMSHDITRPTLYKLNKSNNMNHLSWSVILSATLALNPDIDSACVIFGKKTAIL